MPQSVSSPVAPISSLSDAEIAHRAAGGDGSAFRVIMERNNGRLYRVARSVLKNDSEAEDVVQESYVRAYPQLKAFRGESSLATWLTRITLNEALGRLRRRRPTSELSDLDSPAVRSAAEVIWFPGAADGSDPERAASRHQIAGLLEKAIDALPEPFRVVFVMRAVEEMTVEETADALAIPQATVKTRLHRARRLLRESIQAEIGSVLSEAFPFAGRRCARTAEIVLDRLGLADASPPS